MNATGLNFRAATSRAALLTKELSAEVVRNIWDKLLKYSIEECYIPFVVVYHGFDSLLITFKHI